MGFALLIGGLSSLAAIPMFNFSSLRNNFFPMDLTVVLLEAVAVGIGICLHFKMERPIRQEAQKKALEQQTATDELNEEATRAGKV